MAGGRYFCPHFYLVAQSGVLREVSHNRQAKTTSYIPAQNGHFKGEHTRCSVVDREATILTWQILLSIFELTFLHL